MQSQQHVEKQRILVEVQLSTGISLFGYMYAGRGTRISDVLNDQRAFLPFEAVDGKTTLRTKEERIEDFRTGQLDVLIGTATLATGTDGIDKVCDTMVILDDTDDDSLRRQLVGRILPRGESAPDYSNKVALQFIYDN